MFQNSVKSILIFFFILILKTIALTAHKHLTHIHHALRIADQQSIISFSNYNWKVRAQAKPTAPGPNLYSNSQSNVWIDDNQYLHMKIRKQDNKWYSSQIDLLNSLGYGSYVFSFDKGTNLIDPNAILYLFSNLNNIHEIDIDLTQWGDPNYPLNTQYSIQPQNIKGNYMRFPLTKTDKSIIHAFTWTKDSILFQTFYAQKISEIQSQIGIMSTSQALQLQWKYKGVSIKVPNNQNIVICFWLIGGRAPINGQDQQIVMKQFKYLPVRG